MGSADQVATNHLPQQQITPGFKQLGTASSEPVIDSNNPVLKQNSDAFHLSFSVCHIIKKAKINGGQILDLSKQDLKEIPEQILDLFSLEYVYLEGNQISHLPDDVFDKLPNLKWLDLRNNQLIHLPCTYLAGHQNLRTLLLQGNLLRTLPLELGTVEHLKGLSLSGNPLEFPPVAVIAQGTDYVLRFLREALLSKAQGKAPLQELDRMTRLSVRDNDDEGSDGASSEDNLYRTQSTQHSIPGNPLLYRTQSTQHSIPGNPLLYSAQSTQHSIQGNPLHYSAQSTQHSIQGSVEEDFLVQPRSAALHRPVSYYQIRQQHMERVNKAGAAGKVNKADRNSLKKSKSRTSSIGNSERRSSTKPSRHIDVSMYPTLPPADLIEDRAREDIRLKRIQQIKEKQESILQKRRNDESLKDFRQDTKQLQNQKYRQRLTRGEDYDDTAGAAPFGFDDDFSHVMNREQQIKHEVKLAHERMSRPMAPEEKERQEEARAQRDLELDRKVKQHTTSMIERRQRARGTAAQELEAAKREMEIGRELEHELHERRKELEYRFTAFTGDTISVPRRNLPKLQPHNGH